MVNNKLLEPFAHLETKRKNYHKEDINIVIDATDWGHIVGEIEVSFSILLSGILKIENVKKRNLGLLEWVLYLASILMIFQIDESQKSKVTNF